MTAETLFQSVKAAKEYACICDDTLRRVTSEAARNHKNEKAALKAAKSRLRELSAAFIKASDIKRAAALIDGWEGPADPRVPGDVRDILALHASTRERMGFFPEMYGHIMEATGLKSILDIGCGCGPMALALLPTYSGVSCLAMDVNVQVAALLNAFFAKTGIKGAAEGRDVLSRPPSQDEGADCAFLFKLLPLLERAEKGGAARLCEGLNCRHIALTFPTRSLSGKNVGMAASNRRFTEEAFPAWPRLLEQEYPNELLFILKNPYF